MTIISKNQKCQAFDPIMIFPEKTENIVDHRKANTSCVAPAYVFLEGSRGSRYLCDYHYYNEKSITIQRTPELWENIEKVFIDEREEIKKTFSKNTSTSITENYKCWCKGQSYIKISTKDKIPHDLYLCNFHFRKTYFRYYSNSVVFEDIFNIVDERYLMKMSIAEESNNLNHT